MRYLRVKIVAVFVLSLILYSNPSVAQPIKYEVSFPTGNGPFPAVITLHTSGGYEATKRWVENFKSHIWTEAGYAVFAPNFFVRHGITPRTRMDTFTVYREKIERELSEIIEIAKKDTRVDAKNIFAVGFSNGGFWASYLAGTSKVAAGASHYGVWKGNFGREITNPYPMAYFSKKSSPVLALHGADDGTQKMRHVDQAWSKVRSNGATLISLVYPGVDHAWDSKSKRFDAWNPTVTQDSLKRTMDFFRGNMR